MSYQNTLRCLHARLGKCRRSTDFGIMINVAWTSEFVYILCCPTLRDDFTRRGDTSTKAVVRDALAYSKLPSISTVSCDYQ